MNNAFLLEAIAKKLEGEIAMAKANINVYINNPSGIGEHSEVAEAIEEQLEKLAEAEDKLDTLLKHYGNQE